MDGPSNRIFIVRPFACDRTATPRPNGAQRGLTRRPRSETVKEIRELRLPAEW